MSESARRWKTRTHAFHLAPQSLLSRYGENKSPFNSSSKRKGNRSVKFEEMTQKTNIFKGQKKRKSIPPNRHGKPPQTRKGKKVMKVMKPSKISEARDADRELTKFINYCNEVTAATAANKEGGQLGIVKPQPEFTSGAKK